MFNFLKIKSLSNIKYLPKFFLDTNNSFFEKLESLLYIVLIISPIDIIPEYIVGFGLIDDVVILTIFLNRILSNLDKYKYVTEDENQDEIIEVDYKIKDEDDFNDK
jgi:uncharacterized membrane protein YkvA (DUF1232 family)